MTFRPILGASVKDADSLRYPLLASYKLDGIRAIWWSGEFMSRKLKTIPNRQIQQMFRNVGLAPGTDGELICGEPNASDVYRVTNSCVMSEHSSSHGAVRFFVFDNCEINNGFAARNACVNSIPPLVVKLEQHLVSTPAELLYLEERALIAGYEGLVLRALDGPYKHGRSTLREQYLLKLKRFSDAEATVVGFEELLHNANEATINGLGYIKRSSHQEGKLPMGTLGSLVCEMEGVRFRIGTGFTATDRAKIWRHRDMYFGRLVKFKSLSIGVKVAPRHPVWLGWRDKIDL